LANALGLIEQNHMSQKKPLCHQTQRSIQHSARQVAIEVISKYFTSARVAQHATRSSQLMSPAKHIPLLKELCFGVAGQYQKLKRIALHC